METVYKPESLHLHDTLSTSEAVMLAKDSSNDKGKRTAAENIFNHIGRAISDRQLL